MNKEHNTTTSFQPLAARLRPTCVEDYVGQQHLLGEGKPLRRAIETGSLHSMILWGPPGTGKTTLAHLLAESATAEIERFSAVLAGVKDIRLAVERAKQAQLIQNKKTIMFVDEVHRFNKAQQDAFLPFVEDGTVTLIGATTENPSFELNNALLSRARVYVLKSLKDEDILQLLERALTEPEKGYGKFEIDFPLNLRQELVSIADGDGRRCLNLLEVAIDLAGDDKGRVAITEKVLAEVLTGSTRRFDKKGDAFYEQISALHKSVRGSDPDAALYWLSRMLEAGCYPLYIARRVVRMASEDIGNADPRALTLAMHAWDVYERLGDQEGTLALAQAVVYLACAPKSNAVYTAFNAAWQDAKEYGSLDVPMHLRNAPTKLMKNMGYGKDYRYAHNEAGGVAKGERYFPDDMPVKRYYAPVERGLEIKIKQKLESLRKES